MGYLEDQTKKINDQYNSELAMKVQGINKQKDDTIGSLNNKFTTQAKVYKGQRVNADTEAAMSGQRLKEQMAAMGAFNSGDNITANSRIGMDRANNINSIQSAQNDYRKLIDTDINRASSDSLNQINDVTNMFNAKRSEQLRALEEAERARQLQIAEAEKARQFQAQQAELQRQAQMELQRQSQAQAASRAAASNTLSQSQKTQVLNAARKEAAMNPSNANAVYNHYNGLYGDDEFINKGLNGLAFTGNLVSGIGNIFKRK